MYRYIDEDESLLFENGTKRSPGALQEEPDGLVINLGSGNYPIGGALNLDAPAWRAPILTREVSADMDLPPGGRVLIDDGTVAVVHAYHFLEHLGTDDALMQIREIDRVLCPKGVAYIVVPYAMSPLAFQAPDHRTYWTEGSFQDMFYSSGYDTNYGEDRTQLEIAWMKVAGVSFANLCLFVQLIKWTSDVEFETPWRR